MDPFEAILAFDESRLFGQRESLYHLAGQCGPTPTDSSKLESHPRLTHLEVHNTTCLVLNMVLAFFTWAPW